MGIAEGQKQENHSLDGNYAFPVDLAPLSLPEIHPISWHNNEFPISKVIGSIWQRDERKGGRDRENIDQRGIS